MQARLIGRRSPPRTSTLSMPARSSAPARPPPRSPAITGSSRA
jgi:hypothetical protein